MIHYIDASRWAPGSVTAREILRFAQDDKGGLDDKSGLDDKRLFGFIFNNYKWTESIRRLFDE